MAAREFVAVTWNPGQAIDEDSLSQMNDNINYLRDQSVDGLYQHRLGGVTDTNIKILCGTATITPVKSATAVVTVNYAKLFSPNSYPVVTATIVNNWTSAITMSIRGIGTSALPNAQGFAATVYKIATSKVAPTIKSTVYINWIAMGY